MSMDVLLRVARYLAGFPDGACWRHDCSVSCSWGGGFRGSGSGSGVGGFDDFVEVLVLVVFGFRFPDVGFVV
jgi:hypothetical protein